MGLVTILTERRDIPHESGEWMELRRLSWKEMEEAKSESLQAALKSVKQMGMEADSISNLLKDAGTRPDVAAAAADPLTGFDMGSLLKYGIVAWSYDAPVADNLDFLDAETAEWAARQILEMCGLNKEGKAPGASNGTSSFTVPSKVKAKA